MSWFKSELEKIIIAGKENLEDSYLTGFLTCAKRYVESIRVDTNKSKNFALKVLRGYEKEWEFKQVIEDVEKDVLVETVDQHRFLSYAEVCQERDKNKKFHNSPSGVMPDFDIYLKRDSDFKPSIYGYIWFEHFSGKADNHIWVKDATFDAIRGVSGNVSTVYDLAGYPHKFYTNIFVKGNSKNRTSMIDSAEMYVLEDVKDKKVEGNRIIFDSNSIESYQLFKFNGSEHELITSITDILPPYIRKKEKLPEFNISF